MTVIFMLLVEILASRFGSNKLTDSDSYLNGHSHGLTTQKSTYGNDFNVLARIYSPQNARHGGRTSSFSRGWHYDSIPSHPTSGENQLGYADGYISGNSHITFASQLMAIVIFEFGVVFHSIFIGLALATASNLIVLLAVISFHQFFEGLGLGSRLALVRWGSSRQWWSYFLALLYGLSTPLAIVVGLVIQPNNAENQILANGIFDAISAGILMYTGLVELLAHEFILNKEMCRASLGVQLLAYGCVVLGAGVMALLANWA